MSCCFLYTQYSHQQEKQQRYSLVRSSLLNAYIIAEAHKAEYGTYPKFLDKMQDFETLSNNIQFAYQSNVESFSFVGQLKDIRMKINQDKEIELLSGK